MPYRFGGSTPKYTEKMYLKLKQPPFVAAAAATPHKMLFKHTKGIWQICTSDKTGTHSVALTQCTAENLSRQKLKLWTQLCVCFFSLLCSPKPSGPNNSALATAIFTPSTVQMRLYLQDSVYEWLIFRYWEVAFNSHCNWIHDKILAKNECFFSSSSVHTAASEYIVKISCVHCKPQRVFALFRTASRKWRSAAKLQLNWLIFIWHGWILSLSLSCSRFLGGMFCCFLCQTSLMFSYMPRTGWNTSIFRTPTTKTVKPIHDQRIHRTDAIILHWEN